MAESGSTITEALFGKKVEDVVWQDREIRFDLGPQELQCRRGEMALKSTVGMSGVPQLACSLCPSSAWTSVDNHAVPNLGFILYLLGLTL